MRNSIADTVHNEKVTGTCDDTSEEQETGCEPVYAYDCFHSYCLGKNL